MQAVHISLIHGQKKKEKLVDITLENDASAIFFWLRSSARCLAVKGGQGKCFVRRPFLGGRQFELR